MLSSLVPVKLMTLSRTLSCVGTGPGSPLHIGNFSPPRPHTYKFQAQQSWVHPRGGILSFNNHARCKKSNHVTFLKLHFLFSSRGRVGRAGLSVRPAGWLWSVLCHRQAQRVHFTETVSVGAGWSLTAERHSPSSSDRRPLRAAVGVWASSASVPRFPDLCRERINT